MWLLALIGLAALLLWGACAAADEEEDFDSWFSEHETDDKDNDCHGM